MRNRYAVIFAIAIVVMAAIAIWFSSNSIDIGVKRATWACKQGEYERGREYWILVGPKGCEQIGFSHGWIRTILRDPAHVAVAYAYNKGVCAKGTVYLTWCHSWDGTGIFCPHAPGD